MTRTLGGRKWGYKAAVLSLNPQPQVYEGPRAHSWDGRLGDLETHALGSLSRHWAENAVPPPQT